MDIDKISRKEEKIKLGKKIAERVKDGQTIGFGSGSTSYLTAIEIGKKVEKEHLHIIAIPTSKEIENVCKQYKIQIGNLVENKIDWAFDGADEVDPDNNMIKGMGAAMFKEKLNIANSKITYILVDKSKMIKELDTNFPIPVECHPLALNSVKEKLIELGAIEIKLRQALKKDGPVITENNNLILDVRFTEIYETLEKDIKDITGVIESGLFTNSYNIEIIN